MIAPAPLKSWGVDLEPDSIKQLENACRLPISAKGALMPDAHVGYGLPIGGVLATRNAVIPYGVGVDIACRMRLSVLDLPPAMLGKTQERRKLIHALESQTRFGVGGSFEKPNEHAVLDADWSVSPVTKENKDRARAQLGTSGSGNHFVEYGTLTLQQPELGLEAGEYLALLSHSGSRGTGAAVCTHYSRLAKRMHPDLPRELTDLAWLDLDTPEGHEYWDAMSLMGNYAAANHEVIHRRVVKALGAEAIAHVENHHNFAWKETHDLGDGKGPQELIVHRKGATPAGQGVLGVIPGSMATPGFVVRGKGSADSLFSASHGAGRAMSRTKAREKYRFNAVAKSLLAQGVEVLSAGADEVPYAYKDIHAVMERQQDLVEVIARFDPKVVKMAPAGEKPED